MRRPSSQVHGRKAASGPQPHQTSTRLRRHLNELAARLVDFRRSRHRRSISRASCPGHIGGLHSLPLRQPGVVPAAKPTVSVQMCRWETQFGTTVRLPGGAFLL